MSDIPCAIEKTLLGSSRVKQILSKDGKGAFDVDKE